MKVFEAILTFLFGTACSLLIITSTDFNAWGDKLIPYIGPALFGGTIYLCVYILKNKINNLEDEIKKLKNKEDYEEYC